MVNSCRDSVGPKARYCICLAAHRRSCRARDTSMLASAGNLAGLLGSNENSVWFSVFKKLVIVDTFCDILRASASKPDMASLLKDDIVLVGRQRWVAARCSLSSL